MTQLVNSNMYSDPSAATWRPLQHNYLVKLWERETQVDKTRLATSERAPPKRTRSGQPLARAYAVAATAEPPAGYPRTAIVCPLELTRMPNLSQLWPSTMTLPAQLGDVAIALVRSMCSSVALGSRECAVH